MSLNLFFSIVLDNFSNDSSLLTARRPESCKAFDLRILEPCECARGERGVVIGEEVGEKVAEEGRD